MSSSNIAQLVQTEEKILTKVQSRNIKVLKRWQRMYDLEPSTFGEYVMLAG